MDSERSWRWLTAAALMGPGGALAGIQMALRLDPRPFWIILFTAITGGVGALTGAAAFRTRDGDAGRSNGRGAPPRARRRASASSATGWTGERRFALTGFCICLGAGVLCLSASATALEIAMPAWMIGIILQADSLRRLRRGPSTPA